MLIEPLNVYRVRVRESRQERTVVEVKQSHFDTI